MFPIFLHRHPQKGFSLIEMLLVLGVLAVLLIAAFVVYPKVRDASIVNTEVSNIRAIQAATRNLYINKGFYTGLDVNVANQARIFPESMNGGKYTTNTPIKSSWGGEVILWPRPNVLTPTGNTGFHYTFGISYQYVPPSICPSLISGIAGDARSIIVASNNADEIEVLTKNGLDIEKVTSACNREIIRITLTSS